MSILPIVTYDDPILRQKTNEVDELTDHIKTLITDMFETMYNSDGVGLAAPQIGSSLSIFVIDADSAIEEGGITPGPLAFINPEIINKKGEKIQADEGCLSIPNITDKVTRPDSIVIKYLDQNFNQREEEYTGWVSRVIQHEYDHLQGVLFIDHLSAFRRRMHKSELKEIKRGESQIHYPIVPKK
jgi:peptide deformylase